MKQRPPHATVLCTVWLVAAGVRAAPSYSVADFTSLPKFDAHLHANTDAHAFLDVAAKDGFEILSINVDYARFAGMGRQAEVAHELIAFDPHRFHFATTFSMKGFGEAAWTADTIRRIDTEIQRGAIAV